MKLSRGTQVVYVPDHVKWQHGQPFDYPYGAYPGFVTSGPNDNGDYFCRFWRVEEGRALPDLRTKANSESVSPRLLVEVDTLPQEQVLEALEAWC